MAGPRGDFWCFSCDELMELPLKAAACPVCGGLLERRFTTAPGVIRGAEQGRDLVPAAMVENAAADEFSAQKAARTHTPQAGSTGYQAGPIAQTVQSREGLKIGVPAIVNALSPQAKYGSHEHLPMFNALRRIGGPRPGAGSKTD